MTFNGVKTADGVAVILQGDTLISIWREPLTGSRWAWYWSELEAAASRSPDGVQCFSIVLATSSPPNAEVRRQMQEDFRELGDALRRFVLLPCGSALWSNVVRAIVRGLLMVSGHSKRQVVVAMLAEGLDQLEQFRSTDTPSRATLELMVKRACNALGVEHLAAA